MAQSHLCRTFALGIATGELVGVVDEGLLRDGWRALRAIAAECERIDREQRAASMAATATAGFFSRVLEKSPGADRVL